MGPPAAPEVFVGAGDIALCTRDGNHEATAQLLDAIGGTVFALGDNAYYSGTAEEYRDCYDRTWGRHKNRTRPVPGNHEYESPGSLTVFRLFRHQRRTARARLLQLRPRARGTSSR